MTLKYTKSHIAYEYFAFITLLMGMTGCGTVSLRNLLLFFPTPP